MLGGFSFTFKLEGFRVGVFSKQSIKRQGKDVPTLEIDVGVIAVLMGIQQEKVAAKILLKEIKVLEYYRREEMRAFTKQVNNSAGNALVQIYEEHDFKVGRGSV